MEIKERRKTDAGGFSKAHTAAYIEELVGEMERLAAHEGIEPLRDLLRLAKEEARRAAFYE